jgi:hypothetical protein
MNRFMQEISLKNGLVAVVDDCDYDRIARYDWSPKKGRRGAWYAQRMIWSAEKSICREMQREVMDPFMTVPGRSLFVDHRNHDPLDNRRDNLRWLTPHESVLHRRRLLSNTIGYHGIQEMPDGLYKACVSCKRKRYTSYCHVTAEDAARAYNRLAQEHHGDLALLNDISDDKATFSPKAKELLQFQCPSCVFTGKVLVLGRTAYFSFYDGSKLQLFLCADKHVSPGYRQLVQMHANLCAAQFNETYIHHEEPQ